MIETKVHVMGVGSNTAVGVCCPTMVQALQGGTDAEGYGSFAYVDRDGSVRFSSALPVHSFCPWCGKPPTARVGNRDTP